MKNSFLILIATMCFFSCKDTEPNNKDTENEKLSDTSDSIVAGSGTDEHGCLGHAGYTWSVLEEDCVRLFEIAFALQPVNNPDNESAILVAYTIFSQDGTRAEVFFPDEQESKVFIRMGDDKPWIYEDWKLIADEGYSLKKGNTVVYVGDAEPGPRVIGSDIMEEE